MAIPIIGEKTEVYIVLIDSRGIQSFQLFNLDRWANCQAIYDRATNPKKSHVLFKIRLPESESQTIKVMINSKTYMHAAD